MKFFILWNPDSNLPPTARFSTRRAALRVARQMSYIACQKNEGSLFYVCQAVEYAHTARITSTFKLGAK